MNDDELIAAIAEEKSRTASLNPLDVLDAQKRMERLLKSAEGREAFRRVTGLRDAVFAAEVEEQRARLPIVAVLMPSYRAPDPFAQDAMNKVFQAARNICQIYIQPCVSTSVVHWSRNYALTTLLKSFKPFDYVLFVDDDIAPPPDALVKLLGHKKDVVAAGCTVRQDPPLPNFRIYKPDTKTFHTCFDWTLAAGGQGLIGGKDWAVGTGMMLISIDALQKVGEYYINCAYEKKYLGLSGARLEVIQSGRQANAKATANFWWFQFLQHPEGEGEYGEDISFCFKCNEIGIGVFIDTSIRPKHMGSYGYSLDDYDSQKLDHYASLQKKDIEAGTAKAEAPRDYTSKISILLPSRGRPESVKRLIDSLRETSHVMPEVVVYNDSDDEADYSGIDCKLIRRTRQTLSACWNDCAKVATGEILMFAADDIVFHTKNWDCMVAKAFEEHPDKMIFVHGDDGHWGSEFGTHGFLHRKWVEAVGYILPPYFSADYGDTWINEVANSLGRRVYLPFTTEHMHPLWGKAEIDKTHEERLARARNDKVEDLYRDLAPKRAGDADKIRSAMNEAVAVG